MGAAEENFEESHEQTALKEQAQRLAEDREIHEETGSEESVPTTKKDFTRHATVALTDRRRNKWALQPVSAASVQRPDY
ncbi:hypothetical protein KQX54_007577 [Cotesia glomerata]|uniref:Uncharacterized protein n=1 Tax=Cotesia glomerata TaxID=32391 RepID=A0AAV7IWS7_COTGL|nr:hypothetical protein KQX54_007577 [Cotesia glomerata]